MGHFDKSVNSRIKKDEQGRTVYFPWAYLGKGRVMENPQAEAGLRKFVAAYNIAWGLIAIGGIFFTQDHAYTKLLFWAVPVMMMVYYLGTVRALAGCPVSGLTFSFREYQAAVARNVNAFALLVLLLGCIGFTVLCAWAVTHAKNYSGKAVCAFGIVFFALNAWQALYRLMLADETSELAK